MRSVFGWLALSLLVISSGCLGKSETQQIKGKNPPSQSASADGATGKLPGESTDARPAPNGANPKGGTVVNTSQPVPIKDQAAELSPENTRIMFVGTHVGDKPDPRTCGFAEFTGLARFEGTNLKQVTVEMKADSIYSFSPDLTNHLKSGDFLDTRESPTIKFESTSIQIGADGKGSITGNLTLLKTTKEVSIPVELSVQDNSFTLKGETRIDRTEFGMSKMTERVSKDVALSFDIGQKSDPTSVLAK